MEAHALAYAALSWLAAQPQWLALAVCGFIAFIEYPVPPLPHDVVVVAGGILAAHALLDPVLLIVIVTVGSVLGALTAWKLGGLAGTHPRVGKFIARFVKPARLDAFREKYRKRGRLLIAANRFLPGVRTTIMFAAGLFRVPASDVAIFGALSAFAWNALLIGLGFLLGENLDRVITLVERYSLIAWGVVGLVVVVVAARLWLWHARRHGRHPQHPASDPREAHEAR